MMQATLIRTHSGDEGTFGVLAIAGSPRVLYTVEPPWVDNAQNRSCIPCGTYPCEWTRSPSRGWLYQLADVPGRTAVQLHVGNFAGGEGHLSNSQGCILPGLKLGKLSGQAAVLSSREALAYLHAYCQKRPFTLHVLGCVGHQHSTANR